MEMINEVAKNCNENNTHMKRAKFYETYIGRVLIAINQLCNALSGGNEDVAISARTGHGANIVQNKNTKWYKVLESIIDLAFYPVEGPMHCLNSYYRDRSEDYHISKGNKIGTVIVSIFVIIGSILISIVTWTIWIFRKIFNDN